jgi:hypothetical protein
MRAIPVEAMAESKVTILDFNTLLHTVPAVHSASNRDEYQKHKNVSGEQSAAG